MEDERRNCERAALTTQNSNKIVLDIPMDFRYCRRRDSTRGTDQGGFQVKPIGFVIQEVLLDIEPQAIFLERLVIGRFVAAHIPKEES